MHQHNRYFNCTVLSSGSSSVMSSLSGFSHPLSTSRAAKSHSVKNCRFADQSPVALNPCKAFPTVVAFPYAYIAKQFRLSLKSVTFNRFLTVDFYSVK